MPGMEKLKEDFSPTGKQLVFGIQQSYMLAIQSVQEQSNTNKLTLIGYVCLPNEPVMS